jgi:hypothetical protein
MGPILSSATLALVVVLSACSADGVVVDSSAEVAEVSSSAETGLSQEQAVQLARGQVGTGLEFVRADLGGFPEFLAPGEKVFPAEPPGRLVWAIDFQGIWAFSCPITPDGQVPDRCGDLPATVRIMLDYWTGEALYIKATGLE